MDLYINAEYEGETKELLSMKHEGGRVAFPYIIKSGTEIIVYVLDKEEYRDEIEKKITGESTEGEGGV